MLSSFESYGQVLHHLVDKAYKGLQMHCPVCTSALFKTEEKVKVKSVVTVPEKPERYSMTRDVWKEFAGAYSTMKDMQKELVGGDQVAR